MTFLTKVVSYTQSLPLFAAGAIGVGLVIAWHEFGHFLFAKLFGMRVPSFSIGFGPKLLKKQIGATEFSLSAIPWGGYVELATPEGDLPLEIRDQFFEYKPYWQKMLVIGGGILFNLIFAYTVFIGIYAIGIPANPIFYPENAKPVIAGLLPDSPATKAGLIINDQIISIDSQPFNTVKELSDYAMSRPGQQVIVTLKRGDKVETKELVLGSQQVGDQSFGFLGITAFEMDAIPARPLGAAITAGVQRVNAMIKQLIMVFRMMFTARTTEGLGGPIMIFSQTIKSAERGIMSLFAFLALISINLAIINLVPLPILDGGQALIITIEAIIRRPLPIRLREVMAIGTWLLFVGLTLYLSFKDIKFLNKIRGQARLVTAQTQDRLVVEKKSDSSGTSSPSK